LEFSMNSELWQQIDQLFHSALERESGERAAFLAQACNGDESLRQEVESLIESHEQLDSFIEAPAADIAAELLAGREAQLAAGHSVGPYQIVSLLGEGGMGQVYLADDTRLNRKLALKLLPPHFTINRDRVRRFEREARAASALNHPNIVTIYEIGQSNSAHFIATEFVDGKTLRQMMNEKPLKLSEALNVAMQVASALTAAHAAGIVHRDIKPENIMIRADGYVKILDFGLAKLTDPRPTSAEPETPTLLQSNPGLVMGTVQYMSPEQARGKKVDVRTDIWSLGVVLYELLAGRVPFSGETPSHVMVSLMEDELPPLTSYANVPAELDRIVNKALRKNQKERYQTASDLALDLKHLKRELQLEVRLKGTLEAVPSSKERTTKSDGQAVGRSSASEALTVDHGVVHRTASVEYLVGEIKSHKIFAVVALLVLVAAGIAFGLYKLGPWARSSSTVAAVPFQTIEFIRLTNSGRVNDAVISPDGKYVAYVAENGGKQSIWLRQVTTSNKVEVVPPADTLFHGATFSNDSNYLYYIVKERNNSIGVLNKVPVLGGVSAKLIVDVDGPISLSPDGKQFAFVRGSSAGERALMLANADGSDERKLASRTGYYAFSFGGPAWSPDGTSIACGAGNTDETGHYMSVVAVDVADGSVKPLTAQKWRGIGRLAWLQDGKGLILNATDLGQRSPAQLWYLSYPNGEARRITKDLQEYDGVSLTSDSTALVSNQIQTISGIWNAPNDDANRAKQILSNKYDGYGYGFYSRFSWTPNGQIIYTSVIHGTPSIWVMTAQGTGNKQLTTDSSSNSFPSVTSNARYLVFLSDRTGFTNVWRMDADGNNEKQLTNGDDDSWAWCSPDGQWVVYHSLVSGKRTLRRISINGGDSEQLTDYPSVGPVISPDGKWISCYYRPETKAPWRLAIIPFDGGPPVKTFEVPQNVLFASLVRWTPDGLGLAYITSRGGTSNIWIQPLDGSPPKQLTNFTSDQIFWFEWSSDGRQLGVSRGAVTSDVVMIKDLDRVTDSPITSGPH
jgi:serine/threonine protein kinase/Tol biopolymer transport system component